MNPSGNCFVITGGGRGLGRAMACALADKGAHLALVDLDADGMQETKSLCEKAGGSAAAYALNIAKEEEVSEFFAKLESDSGDVHGLINNAGITRDALMVKVKDGEIVDRMSLAEWQAVIDVNLTGVFLCGREAASLMVRRKTAGVIINISSISRVGNIGQSNYSAAKAGVAALTTTWAKELARFGIRCAAIAPGVIATDMTAGMKPEALERLTAGIPLGRLGTPEEIAHTALFIVENDYFSGRVLELDAVFRI